MSAKPAAMASGLLGVVYLFVALMACVPGRPAGHGSAFSSSAPASASTSATPTVPGAPPPSVSTSSPGLSRTPLPTRTPTAGPPKTPSDAFGEVTVSGQVRVAGDCVELVTNTVTWTLLGESALRLRGGQQAKVTGLPEPSWEGPCEGSPLRVRVVA